MAKGLKHGAGGGNLLNFMVVGGTSAPSDPKGNTVWVNTGTKITSWDFSVTEPHRRSANRNLLVYPYLQTTKTESGITFTDNGDGTVKANGTASASVYYRHSHTNQLDVVLQKGTYHLSGCPAGGSSGTYAIELGCSHDNWETTTWVKDIGGGVTFTVAQESVARIAVTVYNGAKVSNLVFKPQLEKGSVATSFVKGDATGQVWIQTAITGTAEFNALKKNGIQIYLASAKQYVTNKWVTKTVSFYQNDEQVSIQKVIVPNTSTTWTKSAGTASATKTATSTTVNITATASANGTSTSSTIYTEFDATSYSTLSIKGTYSCDNTSGSKQEYTIKLLNSSGSTVSTIYSKDTNDGSNTSNASISKTVDISSVTGKCKIQFSAKTWSMASVTHKTVISDCRAY